MAYEDLLLEKEGGIATLKCPKCGYVFDKDHCEMEYIGTHGTMILFVLQCMRCFERFEIKAMMLE